MAVILGTGALAKCFLRLGTKCQVNNLDALLKALPDEHNRSSGLLTYSNHISTLDEPLWCGALPWSVLTRPSQFRWTLAAKDVIFTNALFSAYFNAGQVLSTDRHGPGIYQPALDKAIDVLRSGGWVHIFPEGYVNQPSVHPYTHPFRRFKWGIARLLNEAPLSVNVLPIYLKGFDRIMPEGRKGIRKFLPNIGQNISITFNSKPLDRRKLLDPFLRPCTVDSRTIGLKPDYEGEPSGLRQSRSQIADILRQQLIHLKEATDAKSA